MALLEHAPDTYAGYRDTGGGRGLARALSMSPEDIIEEVGASGLRGRGGAGFPTGLKWKSIREAPVDTPYFVCNAAEGEPATFKDRLLLRRNPYLVLEGVAIAAHAVGASRAFIGLKETFTKEIDRLTHALVEMRGQLGGLTIDLALGPDHFLLGEETGLLEAIEGRPPLPTGVPAYVRGIGAEPQRPPTGVNNVETLANVPYILAEGFAWLRQWGTEDSPGTAIFTVAGDVRNEGCFELPLGTPLRRLIEDSAGGTDEGRTIKAIVPGASHAVITPEQLDTPLDYASMESVGTAMGAGGFGVFDDTACMVEVSRLYARFLHVESCGQCPACKEGGREIEDAVATLESGADTSGTASVVLSHTATVTDGQKCELPTGTRHVMESLVRTFRRDFERHAGRECPSERQLSLPKIVDHVEGQGFVYDRRYHTKQPDWTYADA